MGDRTRSHDPLPIFPVDTTVGSLNDERSSELAVIRKSLLMSERLRALTQRIEVTADSRSGELGQSFAHFVHLINRTARSQASHAAFSGKLCNW